jgi:uncharacterized protein DUF4112
MTATRSTPSSSDRGRPSAAFRGPVVGTVRAERFAAFERRFAAVSRLMDELVVLPGTSVRVGLDPVIGLVPVVGDAISAAVGFWLIAEAARFGIPRIVLGRMVANTLVDLGIGSVPVLGDLFDVVSRSNSRNLALFRRHALDPAASTRNERLVLVAIALIAVGLLWLVALAIGWLLSIRIPAP